MSHPSGVHIFWMAATIQKNLAVAGDIVLEEHDQKGGRLYQLIREQSPGVRYAPRQAMSPWGVLCVIRRPFPQQRLHPREWFRATGIDRPLRVPDARQVRFAILSPWRRPRGSGMRA